MSIDINVLEVLKWEYAAFQAAVLVLFKTLLSLSLSHAWLASFDKFANGLHLKKESSDFCVSNIEWNIFNKSKLTSVFSASPLTRFLVDVNLNGDLMYKQL